MEVGNYVEYLDSKLIPFDLDASKPFLVKTVKYRSGSALLEDCNGATRWVQVSLVHVVDWVDTTKFADSEPKEGAGDEKSVDTPEPPKSTPAPKGRPKAK